MPQSMFGQHTSRVQIEQRAVGTPPVALLAIEQQVKYDFNGLTLDPASDTGRSSVDNLSSVKTPTVLLHLADSAAVLAWQRQSMHARVLRITLKTISNKQLIEYLS